MAAALITPAVIQRHPVAMGVHSGSTERRLMEGWAEGTKVTAGDWFAATAFGLSTSQTAQLVNFECVLRSASTNDYVADTVVYFQDTGRIVLQGATASAATAFLKLRWYE